MVHCDGVIQAHVIKGYLYLNLFIRIEPIWREYHCPATWVRPFWDSQNINTAMDDWKTCKMILKVQGASL